MNGTYQSLEERAPRGARVLLAMSGGVDSGVAAVKLRDAGYEVIGLTMKNYCYGDAEVPDKSCCSLEAIDDARGVCDRVGIRHMVANTEEIFGREVYQDFLTEYADGRTPNPCVRCNSIVRFDTLEQYAAQLDVDAIATGHYARVFRSEQGRYYLARSRHVDKDQAYFLSGLSHDKLKHVLFPLGDDEKSGVRAVAREASLDIADKPESMEVCFMPDGNLREFLDGKIEMRPGNIESTTGEVLGNHDGLAAYTVGQRRGLGISAPRPLYVVRLDTERNVLVVGNDEELFAHDLKCRLTWIDKDAVSGAARVTAQIRSRSEAEQVGDIDFGDDNTARIRFATPQRAIAPGQTVAIFDDDVVIGSGVISASGVLAA